MKTLILAAGKGLRLKHLTNNNPKCLIDLFGKTLLQRQIETLNKSGIFDINVVTGFCHEKIEKLGIKCTFNNNYETNNMVSSLFCATNFFNNKEDLIISYGDIVYNLENLNLLLKSKAEISIMIDKNWFEYWSLRMTNPLKDAESLIYNKDNLITDIGKKTDDYKNIQGQFTGLLKIRADKIYKLISTYDDLNKNIDYEERSFEQMYMTTFIQILINLGWKIKAVLVHNGWIEIDTLSDIKLYKKLASKKILNKFIKLD